MDFFAFFTQFSTQKLFFHSETTRTPFGLPTRNLKECRANFSKFVFYAFQSGKNNKLGSVKNSRGIIRTLQADFFKRLRHRIFQRCLRRFYKRCSQSDKNADPELKEKDGKNIGALFKPEPDKNEHPVQ
jgi:hypothetical protein